VAAEPGADTIAGHGVNAGDEPSPTRLTGWPQLPSHNCANNCTPGTTPNRWLGADGLCVGVQDLKIDFATLQDTTMAYARAHGGKA